MKYKLLKSLPDIETGTIIEYKDDKYFFENWSEVHAEFNDIFYRIFHRDSKDWYEEVKEVKTIYDLKEWDIYWNITEWYVSKHSVIQWDFMKTAHIENFLTEREAKRNKLFRELATRTDKWLPEDNDTWYDMDWCYYRWNWNHTQMIFFHQWLVFENEWEYKQWITPENADLLFKI